MDAVRLLLVSGSSRVGRNVLASLEGRRGRFRVAATGSVAEDLAAHGFDETYTVPETMRHPDAFASSLLDAIGRERPDLVVPCRDDDVVALALLRVTHPDLAPRLLCGLHEVAVAIHDKRRSFEFAERHGLPFAPCFVADAGEDLEAFVHAHGFPLVAKPRSGFASRGVRLILNRAQLLAATAHEDVVFQVFIGDVAAVHRWRDEVDAHGIPLFHSFEGVKRSLQALIAPDGSVVSFFCTKNVMIHGKSDQVTLDEDPSAENLIRRCARVFADEGWRGPLNVQCLVGPDGSLMIHEFNGRFTGATAARRQLGYDEVGMAVEAFVGRRGTESTNRP